MKSEVEPEKSARIFLLTREPTEKQWLQEDWSAAKCLIAYDPRITFPDLEAETD